MTVLLLSVRTVWVGPIEDAYAGDTRGDHATELRILRPLAEQGNADAQVHRRSAYAVGLAARQNYEKAAKWFRLSAAQGNAAAEYSLGNLYFQAMGVAQDYGRAHIWLSLGLRSFGDASVLLSPDMYDLVMRRRFDSVAKKMTAGQIAEAQKLAHDCQLSDAGNVARHAPARPPCCDPR